MQIAHRSEERKRKVVKKKGRTENKMPTQPNNRFCRYRRNTPTRHVQIIVSQGREEWERGKKHKRA